MASLQVDGLISGLDTSSIIEKLLEVESTVVNQLKGKKETYNTRLSLWQEFNTKLLALKNSVSTLASFSTFAAKALVVNNPEVLSATANSQALVGTYSLTVERLASAHQIATSASYTDYDTSTFGEGTITIQVGNGTPVEVTIDSSNNTLQGIASAINSAQAEVRASIVRVQDGFRLLLTSKNTGSTSFITISSSLTGGEETLSDFVELQPAQDARLLFGTTNLLVYESPSNVVSDLLAGVTLTLKGSGPVSIEVAQDKTSIKEAISNFVGTYNYLVSFVAKNTSYNVDTKAAGSLLGDANLYRVMNTLTSTTLGRVSYQNSGYDSLASIGISVDQYGYLSLNETKFNQILEANPEVIQRLLVGGDSPSEKGIASLLVEKLNFVTDPYQGTVKTIQNHYNKVIADIDERIATLEERLEEEGKRWRSQFANLEIIMATYQKQSAWLTQQVSLLSR
ncbi:MAG: flagellar filament capping protein FliD [Candidatus Caldatribacteriaceae bacterium]